MVELTAFSCYALNSISVWLGSRNKISKNGFWVSIGCPNSLSFQILSYCAATLCVCFWKPGEKSRLGYPTLSSRSKHRPLLQRIYLDCPCLVTLSPVYHSPLLLLPCRLQLQHRRKRAKEEKDRFNAGRGGLHPTPLPPLVSLPLTRHSAH